MQTGRPSTRGGGGGYGRIHSLSRSQVETFYQCIVLLIAKITIQSVVVLLNGRVDRASLLNNLPLTCRQDGRRL